jgi:asparagine synthase (glutamine-hydrolysing)
LEPGHFLTITSTGQIKKEKYWDIENFETLNLSTEEDYQERILNMIRDSIRLQMRSDAPIGTFLSGGIDSSCVVALLSELVDQPVRTFSVGFQGGANELPYARVVAEKFRTNHSELYISENDVLPVISEIIHNLDEPLYDSAMIPSLMLSKMAVEKGVKVILNGTGGDEIFGGYNRYLPQRKMWQIVNSLPSNVRKLSGNLISLLDKQRGMVIADPILFFINSISGINFVFAKQFLKNKTHYEIMVNNISDVYSKFIPSNGKKAKRHQLMYLDLKNYLVGDVLSLLDKTTMAASLEGRVPLLDHRIVEMCFEIPDKIKFRNGQLKGVLRDTLKDIIPYEILHLPKAGFAGPLNHWINRSLKESMYEHLVESPISFYQEYLHMEVIKSALDNIEKNWKCSGTLFALYIFSLWYKVHIEGQGISVIRQD